MYTTSEGNTYKKVYICHPYTAGITVENIERVKTICQSVVEKNKSIVNYNSDARLHKYEYWDIIVPIAPHLLFPEFMSEPTLGREVAMDFCKALLLGCDELWVFCDTPQGVSAGMREEISFAGDEGIPIRFMSY